MFPAYCILYFQCSLYFVKIFVMCLFPCFFIFHLFVLFFMRLMSFALNKQINSYIYYEYVSISKNIIQWSYVFLIDLFFNRFDVYEIWTFSKNKWFLWRGKNCLLFRCWKDINKIFFFFFEKDEWQHGKCALITYNSF